MSRVVCNPVNLPYRLQDVRRFFVNRKVFREAADPTITEFQGRYYLFASMFGGFWHSANLLDWQFKATPELPTYDYAPHARGVDGWLYFAASRPSKDAFYRTRDPLLEPFERIPATFKFWDPNYLQDDDGRLYFFWGCSAKPLLGVELDKPTMYPVGQPVEVAHTDNTRRGWEIVGENHDPAVRPGWGLLAKYLGEAPFIEGAWVTKHDGVYYLQYAAPGTESNIYANGYLTASAPLGPYTYSPYSPFSSKPGGFITAAGHGSIVQDEHGNWFHAATMRISVLHPFERRLGLFPAGFDDDGVLFTNQNFADYPTRMPDGPWDPWQDAFAGWMLLSYKKPVTATSAAQGHEAALAVNEDVQTWWAAARTTPGESLQIDLGEVQRVHAVQVNLAEHEMRPPRPQKRKVVTVDLRFIDLDLHPAEYLLETSEDGTTWTTLHDTRGKNTDLPHDFVVVDEGRSARFVRVTGHRMPFDAAFALRGLRVFGTGNGAPPAAVTPVAVRAEPLSARIAWNPVPGAQGYNVRYGLSPDKLYHSWLVYETPYLKLSGLNAGHDYYVAVDAFNENGVAPGAAVKILSQ